MAQIGISVGPLSAVRTATDAKAIEILTGYVAMRGGPADGTAQERLDWVLDDIITRLVAGARRTHIENAERAAREQAKTTQPGWDNT